MPLANQIDDLRARMAGVGAGQIAAQRQFLVAVTGIDGLFATKRGGEPAGQASRAFDGGALVPEVLTGVPVPEDLTVGRPWRPMRDAPVLARLRPLVCRWRTAITVTPTDGDLVPVARPSVYHGTLLSVTGPDVDAGSSEPATLGLVFAVARVV